jgi:ERCC4-type nuclease
MQSDFTSPIIIIDSREQTPLTFTFPTVTAGLTTGDYSVAGLEYDFCIERKTLPDLYSSLTSGRNRFMRELHRMKAYPFARLLIIGSEHEVEQGASRHRGVNPKSILHSLAAIEARGVPVVFSSSPANAAALIERWAFWRCRELLKMTAALSQRA